ncbi:MAG: transposase, partial [Cytophagales bacterium]|nr:transposase [Cytophagales bacterium]
SQEALHLIYGVKEDNTREVLLLEVNPTESSSVWEEYLQSLKHRGSVENVNKQIRRVTKSKVSFDKSENLLDLVSMVIKDFESNNWQKYAVNNFQYWPRNTQLL